jgi:hypothetical protein
MSHIKKKFIWDVNIKSVHLTSLQIIFITLPVWEFFFYNVLLGKKLFRLFQEKKKEEIK